MKTLKMELKAIIQGNDIFVPVGDYTLAISRMTWMRKGNYVGSTFYHTASRKKLTRLVNGFFEYETAKGRDMVIDALLVAQKSNPKDDVAAQRTIDKLDAELKKISNLWSDGKIA